MHHDQILDTDAFFDTATSANTGAFSNQSALDRSRDSDCSGDDDPGICASCGPDTLDRYLIQPGGYELAFEIEVFEQPVCDHTGRGAEKEPDTIGGENSQNAFDDGGLAERRDRR